MKRSRVLPAAVLRDVLFAQGALYAGVVILGWLKGWRSLDQYALGVLWAGFFVLILSVVSGYDALIKFNSVPSRPFLKGQPIHSPAFLTGPEPVRGIMEQSEAPTTRRPCASPPMAPSSGRASTTPTTAPTSPQASDRAASVQLFVETLLTALLALGLGTLLQAIG